MKQPIQKIIETMATLVLLLLLFIIIIIIIYFIILTDKRSHLISSSATSLHTSTVSISLPLSALPFLPNLSPSLSHCLIIRFPMESVEEYISVSFNIQKYSPFFMYITMFFLQVMSLFTCTFND